MIRTFFEMKTRKSFWEHFSYNVKNVILEKPGWEGINHAINIQDIKFDFFLIIHEFLYMCFKAKYIILFSCTVV